MNSKRDESHRTRSHTDAGPQGTQVFSRQEVDELLNEVDDGDFSQERAHISGVSTAVRGQVFAMPSSSVVVGRAQRCGIQIDDGSVSSEHARLVSDAEGWRVVNLLSTNGTFVNDRKISSAPLADGDRIRFGGVEFVFHDPDATGSSGSDDTPGWKRVLPWAAIVAGIVVVAVAWLFAGG